MSRVEAGSGVHDWVRELLFDKGYLAAMKGESVKVYLTILSACGGEPGRSVTISLKSIQDATNLSCPTVIDSLSRLENLGLVVPTTHRAGRTNTYYIPGPPVIS
ncbi:MAG: hypothetical protein RJA81_2422 [Planctomycetota bacterium]|jgi:DNA-binding MarR family transcriptional regulator